MAAGLSYPPLVVAEPRPAAAVRAVTGTKATVALGCLLGVGTSLKWEVV